MAAPPPGGAAPPEQRKLAFRVVFASSQDTDYPASELNFHSPTTKGWQTARFAEYPQEIGVQFVDGPVLISQVQLLSHQHKIATRVELFTGDGPDYFHASFSRLGYLSLDSNERSQFRARELKTVYVKAQASFLKLLLHKNFMNQHNLFNQVGIVAINVLGDTMTGGASRVLAGGAPSAHMRGVIPGIPSAGSVMPAGVNDLAVDMGLDPETASLLREVARRKDAAVGAEDFETAKKLKVVQDSIKAVGGQLASLVASKAKAVEDEDYDTALNIKMEIQRIRRSLSERLAELGMDYGGSGGGAPGGRGGYGPAAGYGPSSDAGLPPRYDERPIRPAPGPGGDAESPYAAVAAASPRQAPPSGAARTPPRDMPAAPSPPGFAGRPGSRAIRPAVPANLDDAIAAEERRIADSGDAPAAAAPGPARRILTKAERAAALASESGPAPDPFKAVDAGPGGRPDPSQLAGVDGAADLPAPEPLSGAAEKDAGPLVDLFGEYVAQCMFSRDWHLREAAVAKMALEVPKLLAAGARKRVSPAEMMSACMRVIISATAKDKIAAVFEKAVGTLLPALLQHSTSGMKRADVSSELDALMPPLMEKLGDNVVRVRDAAVAAVLELSAHPLVGPGYVATFVMHKMSKKQASSWKPLQTRVAVLAELVDKSSLLSTVSPEVLIKYCADNATFAHANGDIRKATEDLAASIYKKINKAVIPLLQPHLRPKQMEEYQTAFAAAGPTGAPVAAPAGRGAPAAAAAAPSGKGAPAARAAAPAAVPGGRSHAPVSPAAAPPEGAEDGVCHFCGGCGPGASEQELDLHYWQSCPMLMACPRCQQIIEIATLPEHLLDECEFKTEFEPCPNCGDAIPGASLDAHLAAGTCRPLPAPSVAQRCSLCQQDIAPEKEGWLAHLLDQRCPRNPRTNGSGTATATGGGKSRSGGGGAATASSAPPRAARGR